MTTNFDDETLQIFLEEAREHLEGIENDFLLIEKAQGDRSDELLNTVFRAVHSVKGGAGFFGFDKIKDLSHTMESVLGRMRKQELLPDEDLISLLLEGADSLRLMVHVPESMDEVDIVPLVESLNQILERDLPAKSGERSSEGVDLFAPSGETVFTVTRTAIENARSSTAGGKNVYLLEFDLDTDIRQQGRTVREVISDTAELTAVIESTIDEEAAGSIDAGADPDRDRLFMLVATKMDPGMTGEFLGIESGRIHEISGEPVRDEAAENAADSAGIDPEQQQEGELSPREEESPSVRSEAPDSGTKSGELSKPEAPSSTAMVPGEEGGPKTAAMEKEGSIRVNVKIIDQLMTLAGELVLARNQLLQGVDSRSMTSIEAISQRMDLVTTDLQDTIMATRMQSVGMVFGKFQRIVRDLSRNLGKEVELVLAGEDVELDKTIIEAISDPLIHLVRNALDHGIETPEERAGNGKPTTGTLILSALHKAGQVLIEITDDGAGIDTQAIRRKATAMGIYTPAQLDEMSDQSLVQLIFKAGFSTVAEVSDLSGRGVGMDVVHANLSKLSGVIDVESTRGQGTTVRITLPLSLAIIPALLVSIGDEQYAIPQHNLVELVRVPIHEADKKIERIGDASVLRLRGELLPLIDLSNLLSRPAGSPACGIVEAGSRKDAINIAVVAAGEFQYGLIVEGLLDSAEIVVKPLGKHLRGCRVYAGATILGSGRVALILDILGISQEVWIHSQKAIEMERKVTVRKGKRRESDTQTLLIVQNGPGEQLALPLGRVGRIERIHRSQIKTVAGRRMLRYGEGNLPLLAVEDVAEVVPREDTDYAFVVQFRTRDRDAGLVVARVVDIIMTEAEVDTKTLRQRGITGSLIVNDKITLVVDPQEIAGHILFNGESGEETATEEESATDEERVGTVLVVEDSPFFLDQIRKLVERAGYCALTANNGLEALSVLESRPDGVDLVLTDIEMPELDGFGLAGKIRSDRRFREIPIIAITTLLDHDSKEKGELAGFDEYMVKLDGELVLERCKHYLSMDRSMRAREIVAGLV